MEKHQLIEIGQRLRKMRNELGLTREQLAELADIGPGFYGQLEVGTSQMSIDTLVKLARCFHVSTDYIIFGEQAAGDSEPVLRMLQNCTDRELKLAYQILKLYLMKN